MALRFETNPFRLTKCLVLVLLLFRSRHRTSLADPSGWRVMTLFVGSFVENAVVNWKWHVNINDKIIMLSTMKGYVVVCIKIAPLCISEGIRRCIRRCHNRVWEGKVWWQAVWPMTGVVRALWSVRIASGTIVESSTLPFISRTHWGNNAATATKQTWTWSSSITN